MDIRESLGNRDRVAYYKNKISNAADIVLSKGDNLIEGMRRIQDDFDVTIVSSSLDASNIHISW